MNAYKFWGSPPTTDGPSGSKPRPWDGIAALDASVGAPNIKSNRPSGWLGKGNRVNESTTIRLVRAAVLVAAFAAVSVLLAQAAFAGEVTLEEGVSWNHDNGTCVEDSGEAGLIAIDGQCVTPTDYDELFSFENLSNTVDPMSGESIADAYGLVDDGVRPSERIRTFMGVEIDSFAGVVLRLSGQVAL